MLKKLFIPHPGNDYKPHIFREAAVTVIFLFTLGVFIFSSLLIPELQKASQVAEIYAAVLASSANVDRAENSNLPPLSVNPLLEEAARQKAADMVAKGYFAHNTPEGQPPWYWISKVGYNYIYAGENLAVDFSDSNDVEHAWMNSPGHRANILNNNYTEIGIATAKGFYNGRETIFVVEMFGSPKIAVAAENPTPEPIPIPQAEPKPKAKPPTPVTKVATAPTTTTPEVLQAEIQPEKNMVTTAKQVTKVSWYQKFLVNPSNALRNIYLGLLLFIALALALFVFIEWRIQHSKNIAYALLLIIIISNLFYINWLVFVANGVVV